MDTKKIHRPAFLSGVCLLSFIGSGMAFIAYFLASLFFDRTSELIIKYSSWNNTDEISSLYFTLLMALYAFSLIGAIRMWKLHKSGFYVYSISQIIILFQPALWINWQAFSVTNVIFTFIFIFAYFLNLKHLK